MSDPADDPDNGPDTIPPTIPTTAPPAIPTTPRRRSRQRSLLPPPGVARPDHSARGVPFSQLSPRRTWTRGSWRWARPPPGGTAMPRSRLRAGPVCPGSAGRICGCRRVSVSRSATSGSWIPSASDWAASVSIYCRLVPRTPHPVASRRAGSAWPRSRRIIGAVGDVRLRAVRRARHPGRCPGPATRGAAPDPPPGALPRTRHPGRCPGPWDISAKMKRTGGFKGP